MRIRAGSRDKISCGEVLLLPPLEGVALVCRVGHVMRERC